MRVLRAVYNRAVEEDLCTRQYPFKNVYTGISKTVKRAVDEETIIRIKALDLSKFPVLVLARDLFMFSFYTRGMSFVDMANLTDDNLKAGYLIYTRSKTSQKLTIRTEPCMDEIIARYRDLRLSPFLLPIYHSESRDPVGALRTYNKRLVRISRLLGLEKPLSSYVSRHTWATLARHRGVSLPVISESMGHENEYTTRIYLASLEQSVIDQANAQVIAL
jgi:integrase